MSICEYVKVAGYADLHVQMQTADECQQQGKQHSVKVSMCRNVNTSD